MHGSSNLKLAQTQLCRPSGYGDYLLLVPHSRVLSYRSVKQAQIRREGYIFRYLPHEVSCLTEVCCPGIPVSFAYYMTDTS